MKRNYKLKLLFIIIIIEFLLSACATHQSTPQKNMLPPEDIPQIGAKNIGGPSLPQPQKQQVQPAIVASLTKKAKKQIKADEMDKAFSNIERAIRIDSSDPNLWNMLANIQLKRGNIEQAEQFARKSNLLAIYDKSLRKKNWLIIAEALNKKGFIEEAKQAELRAKGN